MKVFNGISKRFKNWNDISADFGKERSCQRQRKDKQKEG